MTEAQQQLDASYYLAQMETCQKRADLYQGLAASVADGKLIEVPTILIASAFDDLFVLGNEEKEEAKIAPAALDFVRACYRKNLVSSHEVIDASLYIKRRHNYDSAPMQDNLTQQELVALLLEKMEGSNYRDFLNKVIDDVVCSPYTEVRAKAHENTTEAYNKGIIGSEEVLLALRMDNSDTPDKREGRQKLTLLLAEKDPHALRNTEKPQEQYLAQARHAKIILTPLMLLLNETDKSVLAVAKRSFEVLLAQEVLTVAEVASVLEDIKCDTEEQKREILVRVQDVVAICIDTVPNHVAQDRTMKNIIRLQSLSSTAETREPALVNMARALTTKASPKVLKKRDFGRAKEEAQAGMVMLPIEVVDYLAGRWRDKFDQPEARQIVVGRLLDIVPDVAGNMLLGKMVWADKSDDKDRKSLAGENFARMMRQPQGLRKVHSSLLPAPVQGS